jgi:hypothetical protein
MLIKILLDYQREAFVWTLYDGPEGIDELSGECATLGECFEQIVEARTSLGIQYADRSEDFL